MTEENIKKDLDKYSKLTDEALRVLAEVIIEQDLKGATISKISNNLKYIVDGTWARQAPIGTVFITTTDNKEKTLSFSYSFDDQEFCVGNLTCVSYRLETIHYLLINHSYLIFNKRISHFNDTGAIIKGGGNIKGTDKQIEEFNKIITELNLNG